MDMYEYDIVARNREQEIFHCIQNVGVANQMQPQREKKNQNWCTKANEKVI